MDRIIKFRAWDKEEGKMIYDTEHDNMNYWDWITGSCVEIVNIQLKSERYHWMQCTGLKDKNNNPIFEGDLLKHQKYTYEVKWSDWWFKVYDIDNFYRQFELACIIFDTECVEIIWNIYQNPDLLNNK